MKLQTILPSCAVVASLLLTSAVHALTVPALPPNPLTSWTVIADTGSTAQPKHSGAGAVGTFSLFTPPVIIGTGSGTGAGFPLFAFKGQMALGAPIDEGVWSNAFPAIAGFVPAAAYWMVAQEGDVVGGQPIGKAGALPVEALQTTFYGGTLFTTNSLANAALNLGVYEGNGLNALAGTAIGIYNDGARAVTDGNRISSWAKSGPLTGTRAWDVTPTPVHGLTAASIFWTATGSPKVQCSPTVSEYGAVAYRGKDTTAPFFRRDFIGAEAISPGGFFPPGLIIVRRNDAATASERFGVFHPNLMAIAGGNNVPPTVVWQMSNMYTNAGGVGVLGTAIPNSNSLWCRGGTVFAEIARVGDVLTDFTSTVTIKGFYALHLTDDRSIYRDSDVFYGVNLSTGKRAIYHRHITFPGSLGVPQLIATDDAANAPLGLSVPAISAGTFPVTTLFPYFSVDPRGNVLIKATLAGAPAGRKQSLITARTATNHALEMRSQSGPAFILPTASFGPQPIANFFLTNPEQGPLSRGQAIADPYLGAVIKFPSGSGVYIGQ